MKTVINIKTDQEIKINAQKIARELGIALSDVINASLRNFIRTREVYFSAIPRMTPEFEILIGRVEEDIKTGKNLSPAFSSMDEINKYLDNL
ncbi:MAG: type II toxin-antitoxin system RelB/DinJ family antitoxin [Candidatus Paceibacterota bacterium]|jgi:addiction module RelB/DinJ family antitoxin